MSRLIKSYYALPQPKEQKVIGLKSLFVQEEAEEVSKEDEEKKMRLEAQYLLQDARQQAKKIISEAEEKRKQLDADILQLKQEWEVEKKSIAEKASLEGFNEGFIKGELDAKQEYSLLIDDAKKIIENTKSDYHNQIAKSDETILELSLKIAEKILHLQLEEKRDCFLQIVKQAIKQAKDYSDISLVVHPSMYNLVLSQKDELQMIISSEKNLYIYPDEGLQETGCIIESTFGRIDASIESQLTELKLKLSELLEEG